MMPINPWLTRGACLALGYLLGWLSQHGASGQVDDEYSDSEDEQQPAAGRRRAAGAAVRMPAEELKMVLVVNDELKMGKGKIGELNCGISQRT